MKSHGLHLFLPVISHPFPLGFDQIRPTCAPWKFRPMDIALRSRDETRCLYSTTEKRVSNLSVANIQSEQSALLDAPWCSLILLELHSKLLQHTLYSKGLQGWPPHVKWHGDDQATSSRCLAFVARLAFATHGSFFLLLCFMQVHGYSWVSWAVKTPQSPPVTSCEDACNHGKSSVSSKLCVLTFKQIHTNTLCSLKSICL